MQFLLLLSILDSLNTLTLRYSLRFAVYMCDELRHNLHSCKLYIIGCSKEFNSFGANYFPISLSTIGKC